ncbi:MAG TPA: hypothetical protein VFV98_01855 [Vicinamibacterales bacterium]|nr:hypothetical protein [Vicinamibacterales bacterium]
MNNEDALRAMWTSSQPATSEVLLATIDAVLDEDRAAREKDRLVRLAALTAMALLCPALLWFAAHGKTPLVRGGYALMALGASLMLFAEWMHRTWSRQALPGPADARSQLQKTALSLSRQASLFRTAALWCAPIFVGAALIGAWIYQERSHAGAYLLWASIGAGWLISAVTGRSKGKKLDTRQSKIEQLLSDLR